MAQHIKFTKSVIDSIPLSEEKQIFYRDTVTIGFGLCVGKLKAILLKRKCLMASLNVKLLENMASIH